MAFQGVQYTNKIPQNSTEKIGSFSGYIRRPKNHQTGLTAQFFGENGEEADMILALSLSHLQDSRVFANVYLIKDPDGISQKQDDKYPCIASFECFIRRSNAARDGMIAQLFASNGENADQVAELSKTQYQDCLVFVDIRGPFASKQKSTIDIENSMEIEKTYANKITKKQKDAYQKKEKAYKKMNEILYLSDFITKTEVVGLLGEPVEFADWLKNHQQCAIQFETIQESCHETVEPILVQGLPVPFNYYPVCQHHAKNILDPKHFEDNLYYYQIKHSILLQNWVKHRLKVLFSIDGDSEPDPTRIIEWANSKNIQKYLPPKYKIVM